MIPDAPDNVVSLDELLTREVDAKPDTEWLAWVREVVRDGWGPTLRALVLLVAFVAVVFVIGAFPALCTTIALVFGNVIVRRVRIPVSP
ncbi:hypothetical protein [Actinokineospora iranica]|uniref:hypothetical protein n=1 Tax=Actinokineospora iranica TaxID=1271860 RepID=UPI000B8643A4|nr:hypothetical protein [Actinokineospora iranica]